MLPNLNELIKPISQQIEAFDLLDCTLPDAFTSKINNINNDSVRFGKSASCITNRKGQKIFLSNNWFYIAAILTPLNEPFHIYKELLNKIVDKEALKQNNEQRIKDAINNWQGLDEQDKEYLIKFALEPTWWNAGNSNTGGKSLDRNDALVSPILAIANLVNASQSYVVTLWYFFGANPDLASLLCENIPQMMSSGNLAGAQSINSKKFIQTIYFGSPGTGKSHHVEKDVLKDVPEEFVFRTTFHPDSDYASFVGTYKPICIDATPKSMELNKIEEAYKDIKNSTIRPFHKFVAEHYKVLESIDKSRLKQIFNENGVTDSTFDSEYPKAVNIAQYLDEIKRDNSTIRYDFEPQVFTEAYIKAWKNPEQPVYLVIEEINRGNCAQVFGDLFQLLDRKHGISEYPVKAEAALAKYLHEKLTGNAAEGIKDGKLKLPENLNIIATMNTSDQSLFPMDSAFKRRWEWKYIPTIAPAGEHRTLELNFENSKTAIDGTTIDAGDYYYSWNEFLKEINSRITQATHSDDKQLGFWFVKTTDGNEKISISTFVSKVIFYLWNDIFKDMGPKAINPFTYKAEGKIIILPFSSFFEINSDGQVVENIGVLHTFMKNMNIIPTRQRM